MKVLMIVISSLGVQTTYDTPSMEVCNMAKKIALADIQEWKETAKIECVQYK